MKPTSSLSVGVIRSVEDSWENLLGHYRSMLMLMYLVVTLFFLALGAYVWQRIGENTDAMARERGRELFDLIELTRDWNAGHAGVYVPISEQVQPNPYLNHPQRDQTTVEGRELTMVNPSFMTRQIAELAQKSSGMRFNITSLRPLRPSNVPDAWEAETLRWFAEGKQKERTDFDRNFAFDGKLQPAYRYMAPLYVKPTCLQCHEKLGYQLGDLRGGISVSMPAQDLLTVRDQERKASLLIVLASFIVTSALLHLMVSRARRHYLNLQQLTFTQEGIISERTRELKEINADLQHEVAERRQREHELLIAGAVFESAAEAIFVTDADNRIVRVNPAFTTITGYAASEAIGKTPALLKSGRHSAAFYAELWEVLGAQGHWEGEVWNRHKSGNIYIVWLSISKLGGERGVGRYLAISHDITHRKADEELLLYRVHHDALTDLPNRSLFYDRLQSTFNQAKRYHRIFALLLVDLDRFKEVNDTLGHTAGDELLVEAARRLSSCVRESDTVARLGGDEYAIILSDMASEDEAEQVAQRAVQLLAEPYNLDAGTARISGCVGIALYPHHGQDSEQLMRNADTAMYAAKTGGRNAYQIFSPLEHAASRQGDLL
jgi:diguanylate cyclase (GGDEF)-like protein/PAS domain S-box-containing protein